MRKKSPILGFTLLAVAAIWSAYDFLVIDDGVGYFTSQPRRLLYVAIAGVAGGLLTLIFSRFSPLVHRRLRLITLGACATSLTAALAYFTIGFASLTSEITQSGMWGWAVLAGLSFLLAAILFWMEFYSALRERENLV